MNALQFPDLTWGDADALVSAIRSATAPLEPGPLEQVRAPYRELTATVMTARATTLGAAVGRDFYHHEGRHRPTTPDEHQPELQVSPNGCDPVWDFGVLVAPKYYSFFQDATFAAYHPNHRSKWRAHEMLHGAARFFWRPTMSRFETYLAARLNELLPVAHWYYFDEVDRRRCAEHLRQIPTHYCERCDEVQPYHESSVVRDDATKLARLGFEHVDAELAAIETAIELGRDVEVQYANGLNPSTDGIAYMRAHWNRLTSYSVGAFVERFLEPGRDYFVDLEQYVTFIRGLSQRLVSGDLSCDLDLVAQERIRASLLDLLQRAFFFAEFDEAFEDAAEEIFDESARLLCTPDELSSGAVVRIRSSLGELEPRLLLDGIHAHDLTNVREGLATVSESDPAKVELFVSSPKFWERGTVCERYVTFSDEDEWRLPAAVSKLPRVDLEGERFGSYTDSVAALMKGRLRVNQTLRPIDDTSFGYHFNGTFRVVEHDDALRNLFDAIDREERSEEGLDMSTLIGAVESGLVFWFPEVGVR